MAMLNAEVQRELGKHEAEIQAIQETQRGQAAALDTIKTDIHAIREILAEARGGWRVLVGVAATSATIGAIVAKYLPAIFGR